MCFVLIIKLSHHLLFQLSQYRVPPRESNLAQSPEYLEVVAETKLGVGMHHLDGDRPAARISRTRCEPRRERRSVHLTNARGPEHLAEAVLEYVLHREVLLPTERFPHYRLDPSLFPRRDGILQGVERVHVLSGNKVRPARHDLPDLDEKPPQLQDHVEAAGSVHGMELVPRCSADVGVDVGHPEPHFGKLVVDDDRTDPAPKFDGPHGGFERVCFHRQ
mmetsp:Transcript_7836/g.23077  ORF Transcript_7836/g.23077 Transcript_7836/m.23077 type:complete len:219 (-) Transcript_7836:629-1285(-)